MWLRTTLTELHITDLAEIVVYQDNKSVIMMGTEATSMKRSKHLLTKLTYIKSLQQSGAIGLQYLCTEEMTADVLSKALHGQAFRDHVTRMMGLQWRNKIPVPASEPEQQALTGQKRKRVSFNHNCKRK
jgi:hypothetical protein